MALSKEEIIEAIKEMSVLDMADLVKAQEDEFGVSAAPVAVAAPAKNSPAAAARCPTEGWRSHSAPQSRRWC